VPMVAADIPAGPIAVPVAVPVRLVAVPILAPAVGSAPTPAVVVPLAAGWTMAGPPYGLIICG
jgi:hypothetical protein